MARWKQWGRWGVIAVASCVLLVTVLPEVANSIGLGALAHRLTAAAGCGSSGSSGSSSSSSSSCCSGGSSGSSSSSSSSSCPPPTGSISGTVTVTGAPTGLDYIQGAALCPASAPATGPLCADPDYTESNTFAFGLLTAGAWRLVPFYQPFDNNVAGTFFGRPVVVELSAGETATRNLTIGYQTPAALAGTDIVTKVPTGLSVSDFTVLACPAWAPYTGSWIPFPCTEAGGVPTSTGVDSAPYSFDDLQAGPELVYAGFCSQFGCEINPHGRRVQLRAGHTASAIVTTPFVLRGQGIVTGTVTVTGAPAGFTGIPGMEACQSGAPNTCEVVEATPNYGLEVPAGTWILTPGYLLPPFDNEVAGAPVTVSVPSGRVVTENLTVPYHPVGTAEGTIAISGLPSGVRVNAYTVLGCPGTLSTLPAVPSGECVNEYSGSGGYTFGAADPARTARITRPRTSTTLPALAGYDRYLLPSLPTGTWTLFPGYQTAYGAFTSPTGTVVTVTKGTTTNQSLALAYQPPSEGLVAGHVYAVGVPGSGFSTEVEACSSPPSSLFCNGESSTYTDASGHYDLALTPGTWWVSALLYYEGGSATSAPRMVTVTAGQRVGASFTVSP